MITKQSLSGSIIVFLMTVFAGLLIPLGTEAASLSDRNDKISVKGVVTDQQGEPLIGASVFIKGTSDGSITDIDGSFHLEVELGTALTVSYIGYETSEVVVLNASEMSIVLNPDSKTLDEVVVIGYGTVKKRDLTGSVASVRGEDLASKKTTTLSTALQGTLSGVLVQRNGNAPGASASSIRVRGITTMGDSNPLIIVDGVQTDNIDYVNSSDVESISVLKDAAAASIYGAKAAAGVILITTKRGEKADMSISYNGEYGWEIATEQPDMVGVTRYLEMYNELLYNDNPGAGFYQQYTADQVKNWVNYNATDPDNYPITDWKGLILKNSAPRTTHTVTVSGGNSVVRSKASLSYDEVGALYEGRKFQRFMLRSNNDFTIIKNILSASLDINVRRAKNQRPVYDPFSDLRKIPAIYPAIWENGGIAEGKSGANPYGYLTLGGTYQAWSTQIGGKASLKLTPVKGLSFEAIVSPFINYTKSKQFKQAASWVLKDDPSTPGGYLDGYSTTDLSEGRNDNWHMTTQVIANYMATFAEKHSLNVMAGYENYMMQSETLSAGRSNYELTEYPYLNIGPEDYQTNSGTASEYCSNSFFGRVMYSYADRYLFQVNVRHDGSSRFSKKYRWGTFPSGSAGWVISNENWMQKAKPVLSFMKIRASWGMLGNERIGSNYFPYMALMTFNDALFYKDGEIVSEKTAAQRGLAVEDITWETTTSTDLGIDLGFFRNRLTANFDWYWKTTKDMLLDIQIPYMLGYANPSTNAGTMATRGFDLEIGWNDRKGDFSYNVSFNLSDFTSRIVDINGSNIISGGKIKREGTYFNEWYGYRCLGIYQNADDLAAYPAKLNSTVGVGDLIYEDISGPDGEPDGKITAEYDRVPLGNSLPRFQFGGQFSCAWKGIDFSLAFQGIGKQQSHIATEMVQPLRDNYGSFPAILEGNYWSVFNTAEQNANAKYPKLTYANRSNNYTTSTFWMFNGAYFRLKNVTLGYTFPEKWMSKAKIKALRVYATASDLFSIDNYPQGWDPEMGVSAYPITTSVLLGLSIKF